LTSSAPLNINFQFSDDAVFSCSNGFDCNVWLIEIAAISTTESTSMSRYSDSAVVFYPACKSLRRTQTTGVLPVNF